MEYHSIYLINAHNGGANAAGTRPLKILYLYDRIIISVVVDSTATATLVIQSNQMIVI